jgi:signal transduction histidine kinase
MFDPRIFDLYDRMIGDNVDVPSELARIATVVCETMNTERATIYLIDEESEELVSAAVVGNVAQLIRVPIEGTSLAGYCAVSGRAFIVPDAYGDLSEIDPDLSFNPTWDQLNGFHTKDVICAPAFFKNKLLGVIQIINSQKGVFDDEDLDSLKVLARLLGYALDHSGLYGDLVLLRRLEKEKSDFLKLMVHELKTPISAALLALDSMQYLPQNEWSDLSFRASSQMNHMTALISQMLELAIIKAGEPLGEITILDLAKKTKDYAKEFQELARERGLNFDFTSSSRPVKVRFDSRGYQLIVSNLIGNAIKYTSQGSVSVRIFSDGDFAVFEVSDTGMGIPKEEIPNMFQEFFRASNARTNQTKGSGVGLAGARQIIERFGGNILFESKVNQGSTFTVRIPLVQQ